ncbi:hypothetical protein BDZ45DRAFT_794962 [Acephala macrosclerotiorum]|nr:hypothetical protein BDZ45DRAFT_794962 [Acephala macrosclerotiorum]
MADEPPPTTSGTSPKPTIALIHDIRADPKALQGLTIGKIIENYAKIIEALPPPPIIIGHSFGGFFTQILLSKGLGIAGAGISPAQPSGVLTLSIPLQFREPPSTPDSKALYEKYAIPAAGHVLFQGVLGLLNKKSKGSVDFGKKDRAPLLLVAGTNDHVVPREVVEAEKKHYVGPAVVDFKVLEGRTHGIVNQAG